MEKQYLAQSSEKQMQEFWESSRIHSADQNPGPLFAVDTPPPTISGNLHIGHIFSYTQTDIVARYKRMDGFSVFYPFGFDDNGLATERFVEKKLEISAHKLSRSEFIKRCLQVSHEAEAEFKKLWQAMGLSVDWNNCYSTIAPNVRKLSQESFVELYKKGFVYRKNEPALYCAQCRTSVAQAELEDVEKDSFLNDIVFTDSDGNKLVVATTRPELLYSVVALLYNPDDVRYMHLRNKKAHVPIYGYEVPIFSDEQVIIEKGTGLVMVSTFGDKTDIEWFKKFKLPYRPSLGLDGKWTEQTGIVAGLNAHQARERILKELSEKGLLLRQAPIKHSVNVHERCKKEIEYMMLAQWFLAILDHKKKFLELGEQINWYPTHMKVRYQNWVENLSWDWCLSRQRFYGIPFPVWHCKGCNAVIVADKKQLPIDPQETPYKGVCPACGSREIVPDTDVMDTWNTSSITPYICYDMYNPHTESVFDDAAKKGFIPMGMRPQAHDIIRTWAFYTIVKAWMHNGIIPWSNIVISGHVLSDAKEKISKSRGNDMRTPQKLLEQYPADALRYWTASGALGTDVSFSEAQIKIGMRLITKLWNAFRFINEHVSLFDAKTVTPSDFGTVNEWLLHQITQTFVKYQGYLERYEFSLALDSVEHFFWHDFCDNYLELVKDQLFHPENYKTDMVNATRWTLYHAGLRLLQLYAPYLPHLTDVLYSAIYKDSESSISIHQTKFSTYQVSYDFAAGAQLMDKVIHIITQVRKLKTEKQISLKTPVKELLITGSSAVVLNDIGTQESLIKGVTQAHALTMRSGTGVQSIQQKGDEWYVAVHVE